MKSYFGQFGGRFVPEMLIPALDELEACYTNALKDKSFQNELKDAFINYIGRPSPLYFAKNITKEINGAKIYLKLESLNHTGAHKINNAIGQALLAKRMGKTSLIAETGAGQHGVATATVSAKLGMKCKVFMGEVDIKRQYPNVFSMKLLGAEIVPVTHGTKTLKDAVNEALKYWIENLSDTHYLLGSALGPHPFPTIVRDFQAIIGKEIKEQLYEKEKKLPDVCIACVGGGSNAIGMFHEFLEEADVELIGVEAGGKGTNIGEHACRISLNSAKQGIVQGYKSFFIQNNDGQVSPTHSISAGLDYAGIGPEHAFLSEKNRVTYTNVSDKEALDAFQLLSLKEGIIPALESAHAVAYALKKAKELDKDKIIVVNISGRGDKDLFITAKELDATNWNNFLKAERID
jgi:tryptophan synthase beta chain